ncbi:MAG: tetratricopeptide repeat protein [Dysgonamonadaceae bacterium]|jgi:tetratricopeptide (TPR) repeat protein|nr:tetratricopeptide repeat protein [Dysgonamonadaceae bacterium]
MKRVFYVFLSCLIALSTPAFSQKEVRKELKKGNKEYKQEKYTEAEIKYRKALEANARSKDAAYNLGNSLYKQSKFPEAMQQYQAALAPEEDKNFAAADWHNMGNVFMSNKDYQKSIEAYKQSLRLNPSDDETRYNLALAQKLLENQQQQNDQNQDKQEQNKDEQQKQDQQQQQDKQDQQQQQQNPNEMQKENAEQILNAMMQNERNTQEKVKAEQIRQLKQRKTDKNW